MNYASRKFILAVGVIALVTVAFFMGKITSLEWLTSLGVNGGMYGLLNQIEAWIKTPDAPAPEAKP